MCIKIRMPEGVEDDYWMGMRYVARGEDFYKIAPQLRMLKCNERCWVNMAFEINDHEIPSSSMVVDKTGKDLEIDWIMCGGKGKRKLLGVRIENFLNPRIRGVIECVGKYFCVLKIRSTGIYIYTRTRDILFGPIIEEEVEKVKRIYNL